MSLQPHPKHPETTDLGVVGEQQAAIRGAALRNQLNSSHGKLLDDHPGMKERVSSAASGDARHGLGPQYCVLAPHFTARCEPS